MTSPLASRSGESAGPLDSKEFGWRRDLLRGAVPAIFALVGAATTSVLVARTFGAAGRGQFAAALTLLYFGALIGAFGLPEVVTHRAQDRADRTLLAYSGASGCAAALLLLLPSVLLLHHVLPTWCVAAIITTIPLRAAALVSWRVLLVRRSAAVCQAMTALPPVVTGVLLLAYVGLVPTPHVGTALAVLVLSHVFTAAVSVSWAFAVGGAHRLSEGDNWAYARRAWGGSLGNIATERLDQLVIPLLASPREFGLYAVATTLASPLLLPAQHGGAMVRRLLASRKTSEAVLLRRRALVVTLAAAVITSVAAPVIVPLVFGPSFRSSIAPTIILCLSSVGLAAFNLLNAELLMAGRSAKSMAASLWALVTNVLLLIVLVPPFGPVGAASASAGAYALGAALVLRSVRRPALTSVLGVTT